MKKIDPVALDRACLDLVMNHESVAGDDAAPLIQRINRQHGTHIVDYAQQIGLGTTAYALLDITNAAGINAATTSQPLHRYNVFDLEGHKLLNNATSLNGLKPGAYIINGQKQVVR